MVSVSFGAIIDYRSLSCTRIDRIPLSSESLISVVSRLYGCTVWLLYGTGTVMYGYCMVLTTVWYCMATAVQLYCMVPYSYCMATSTVWLYGTGTTVRLYGTVWLYSCMVLYGQYTTRSSRILLDLVGIPMPSAECMGLYRGGLLSNRSELDAMGGMPLGV